MTSTEQRLRAAMAELAEGTGASPGPVDLRRFRRVRRRRRAAAGAALAAVLAGTGAAAVAWADRPGSSVVATSGRVGAGLPRVADVRCTTAGPVVTPRRIAVSPDGAHLSVTNETGDPNTYWNVRGQREGLGSLASATTTTEVIALAPGEVQVNCSRDVGRTEDPKVTLELLDPDGHYRSIAPESVLGCRPDTYDADRRSATGPTPRDAAAALAATLGDGVRLTEGGGYRGQPDRQYLVQVARTRGIVETSPAGPSGHRATLTRYC